MIKSGILASSGLPLVGPTSGATSMTGVREVFPIKAGYREEVRKILDILKTIGAERIGIVWQDDGLGRDVLSAAEAELVRQGKAAKKALKREVALNPRMVEGYVGAKVAVEAIRRAGPAPTRASVMAALRAMHNFDVGGDFMISFADPSVPGSRYVDVGIIGANGVLMQ